MVSFFIWKFMLSTVVLEACIFIQIEIRTVENVLCKYLLFNIIELYWDILCYIG